ncbi:MAG: response regulator [Proteobacteria bacterium]|nr:response regulator [Pseudomonadota bacterium]MBU1737721.1 response regulator [Pseudomonadota bacterium]
MEFNVLIVDDSKTIRSVVMRVVEMSGVPVGEFLEAENGAEALEVVRGNKVDIILTDINMPVMDGLQFLEELKKDSGIKNIPVIMVSTEASETKITRAVRLGAEGYIKKPFVPETIREIMLKILNKKYGFVPGEDSVAEEGGDLDF